MIGIIWTVLAVSALAVFLCYRARAAGPGIIFAFLIAGSVFLLTPAGHETYALLVDIFNAAEKVSR